MRPTPSKDTKWYETLLAKIALEVISAIVIWFIYLVVRKLLPKKYRIKDKTIKNIVKDFSAISDVMAKKDDDIPTILSKAKDLFDYFYEKKNATLSTEQEFKVFIRDIDDDVEIRNDWSFMSVIFPKIAHLSKNNKIQQEVDSSTGIVEFQFQIKGNQLVKIYAVETYQTFADEREFESYFACTKGFEYHSLLDILFASYEDKIYIHSPGNGKVSCARLELDGAQSEHYIVNEKLFQTTLSEIKAFKELGLQRSILLTGPPGTGKTTFCLELSKRVTGKILKIDSGVFIRLSATTVRTLIENLSVDFIIVDDIDRIKTNDVASFLYCLEAVKNYAGKPTLLATCNNISNLDLAMIRPGRFDDIVEFNYPKSSERELFIQVYMQKLGIEPLPKDQLTLLVKETNGMTNAYLKEYINQLKIERTFQALLKKIKARKKYLKDIPPAELDMHDESVDKISEGGDGIDDY